MVDVAQLVEPRIVIPAVVGSSPIVHPICMETVTAVTGKGARSCSWVPSRYLSFFEMGC